MKELFEFRVQEKYAHLLFEDDEGVRLGTTTRKIHIYSTDPRFSKIGLLNDEIKKRDDTYFHAGWSVVRKYSAAEIDNAELFTFIPKSFFEPEGEECGTVYDESTACPECGSGAVQTNPLFLPVSRIPKGKDFTQTIADEMVVSKRVVGLFQSNGITGATFVPVHRNRAKQPLSDDWFQMSVTNATAEITQPTRTGGSIFEPDVDNRYRCSLGDLIGLNRHSEITLARDSCSALDVFSSRQFIGTRRGVLRPSREIFMSPRLRKLIVDEKLKGIGFEVAYLA